MKINETVFNPKKESLRSWMFKVDEYRIYYASLSEVERIMLVINELPKEFRVKQNLAVQSLVELVGEDEAKKSMSIADWPSKKCQRL